MCVQCARKGEGKRNLDMKVEATNEGVKEERGDLPGTEATRSRLRF